MLPCGDFVNASERLAAGRLRNKLQAAEGPWILLSNLNHSPSATRRSDEIDLVAIGPPGVFVIEVKHWDATYLRKNGLITETEADRVDGKAKRVAGKLRARLDPRFVQARLLLTRGDVKFPADRRPRARGVSVFGLPEWAELLAVSGRVQLTADQVELAATLIAPAAKVALTGDLRAFAGLINLERVSETTDAFHRIYRGQHATRRDRVILHLYDLSASDDKRAEEYARREFDTIQRWQKSPYVPSLLDSFQEVEGYPGELYFFSLVDPAAPTLRQRQEDADWDTAARLAYACAALKALDVFHNPTDPEQSQLLHRQITPETMRVRHDGRPLFTDFSLSRLTDATTVSTAAVEFGAMAPFVAPELQTGGLTAATARSDVYALCATLATIFEGDNPLAKQAHQYLLQGCSAEPEQRASLTDLAAELEDMREAEHTPPPSLPLPAPEYWDEDTVVDFQNSRYKIVSRLGQGGIGQTFKVVELDAHSDEKFGTYVAKLVRHAEDGEAALRAYRKVRAHTTHPHLSVIHEIAPNWAADRFVSLMKWVEGMALNDLIGVLPLHAEDLGEESPEALALRWLDDLCGALGELHRVGLVHGDVSPRNVIVQGGEVTLTDYDTVTETGGTPRGGTPPYASPGVQSRSVISPSDDIYSLAATFFYLLYDSEPFVYGAEHLKERGLNWEGLSGFERLRPFLDRATHPQASERFADAFTARQFLLTFTAERDAVRQSQDEIRPPVLSPNTVPWLKMLLSAGVIQSDALRK